MPRSRAQHPCLPSFLMRSLSSSLEAGKIEARLWPWCSKLARQRGRATLGRQCGRTLRCAALQVAVGKVCSHPEPQTLRSAALQVAVALILPVPEPQNSQTCSHPEPQTVRRSSTLSSRQQADSLDGGTACHLTFLVHVPCALRNALPSSRWSIARSPPQETFNGSGSGQRGKAAHPHQYCFLLLVFSVPCSTVARQSLYPVNLPARACESILHSQHPPESPVHRLTDMEIHASFSTYIRRK